MRTRAFTLIELLVVISIIVVLSAILFPVVVGAGRHANRVACSANLQQLGDALVEYEMQYRRYPKASGRAFLAELFRRRIVKDPRLFICPDSEAARDDGWAKRAERALEGKRGSAPGDGATSYFGRIGGARSIRRALAGKYAHSMVAVACDAVTDGPEGKSTAHGDVVQVLYLDGHVESFPLQEFLAQGWEHVGEHPRRVLGR